MTPRVSQKAYLSGHRDFKTQNIRGVFMKKEKVTFKANCFRYHGVVTDDSQFYTVEVRIARMENLKILGIQNPPFIIGETVELDRNEVEFI